MHDIRNARPEELDTLVQIDDAASALYAEAGLPLSLPADHPFVLAERERWRRAIDGGRALVAADAWGDPLGFVALDFVDGAPYLDQVSVRPEAMRQGLGRRLVQRAIDWSQPLGDLWLTTYAHLRWNQPYYERFGFSVVSAIEWGPELRAIVESQRHVLPRPAERVAMVLRRDAR
jgi:GNAT superfamily N-acetyltransferase